MPAPAFLRDRVLERVELLSGSGSGGDAGETEPPGSWREGFWGFGSGRRVAGRGRGGSTPTRPPGGGRTPTRPSGGGAPEGRVSRLAGSGGSGIHSPRRRGAVVALVASPLLAVGVGVGLGWERAPASSPTDGPGGPIVAGAATSVAPTSPPTTAAPSTSADSSTSVSTTTAAPSPPSLAVTPARVDLGAAGATATLTVHNGGDEPLSWTADPSTAWLGDRPAAASTAASRPGSPCPRPATACPKATPTAGSSSLGRPARSVVVTLQVERRPEIGGLSTQFRGDLHRPLHPRPPRGSMRR